MPTARYPVLICRDLAGGFSAIAIDDEAVGIGANAANARLDLRDFLRRKHKKDIRLKGPDFLDPDSAGSR